MAEEERAPEDAPSPEQLCPPTGPPSAEQVIKDMSPSRQGSAPRPTAEETVQAQVQQAQDGVYLRLYMSIKVDDGYMQTNHPYPHLQPTLRLWHTMPWHNHWHDVLLKMQAFFMAYGHSQYLHVHIVLPSPHYRIEWSGEAEPDYVAIVLNADDDVLSRVLLPTPDDIHVLTMHPFVRYAVNDWQVWTKTRHREWSPPASTLA